MDTDPGFETPYFYNFFFYLNVRSLVQLQCQSCEVHRCVDCKACYFVSSPALLIARVSIYPAEEMDGEMGDGSISVREAKRRENRDCNLLDDLSRGPVGFGASMLSEGNDWVQGRSTILKLTNQRLSCLACFLHTHTCRIRNTTHKIR